MALTRSDLREKIMIILYQIEILKRYNVEYDINEVIKDNMQIENEFVENIVYGVITHENEINAKANSLMKDWSIDRIDKTGASILRMALYELEYLDTPQIVVINEAVELSKKYCDEDAYKFINGLLNKIK